ncbi:abscisic acid 8'-hydroxylase 2 isoform X2 [Ricinus communis]|uniref:abscisic acid 8'-hydroxylase 2 isoform X2 n=1 Tax=Ricinus communis TaxID=3988 RepID=UPI00201AE608|nr:abscisic acid 8'-hydroxylase 2 isoform X2 [Ricinus communis]
MFKLTSATSLSLYFCVFLIFTAMQQLTTLLSSLSSSSAAAYSFYQSHQELGFVLIMVILLFLILFLLPLFLQWHHSKDKRLPPGSMGWPYIGETLKLYTENPNSFFSNRQKRYGDIFKTYILGCPCVMISSPEAARIVLVTKAHLFKPTYPISKEKMIGPEALFFQQGAYHSKLKKLVQASFLPSTIRGSVSQIEQIVLSFLPAWKNSTINTLQEMKRYAFDVAMTSVFGEEKELEMEGIKHLYRCLENGYNSMPLDLPGTPFHKAMKREQEEIRREIIEANRRLTWDDTKRMPLSSRVIQETLRRASILSFTFREAVQDVEFEGYLIPRGWKVLPLFRSIHHSADFFPQPEKFDPSRFEVPPRPNTYMPFGNGVHSCPGSELAKLEMFILIHHLTITYRWQAMEEEDGIQYGPFPVPKKGLPIRVTPRPMSRLAI